MTTQELKEIEERCEKARRHWNDLCPLKQDCSYGSTPEFDTEYVLLDSIHDILALVAHIKAQDEEIEKLKNALNIRGAQESV